MEDALGVIPIVFLLLFKFVDSKVNYKVNAPPVILRFYLGVEILLTLGLFIIVMHLNNDVRILGFEGNRKYFVPVYFSLLLVYPILKYSGVTDIEKWIAKILTCIPLVVSAIAFIPWVGLFIWSFFLRLVGTDREIVFETEQFRVEQIEYVPMSGGHYDFYVIGKDSVSDKEFILDEIYRRPNELEAFHNIYTSKEESVCFVFDRGEKMDTACSKSLFKKLKRLNK